MTGDAVNVAARLQQAAAPGEMLVGAETRGAGAAGRSTVEELRAARVEGEGGAGGGVPAAWRWASRRSGRTGRGSSAASAELALLADAWARAVEGGRCELVTIVGEPGVGKSRLVAELVAGLDARVVRGRCLSYGEGITYFPVVEVVKQLGARPADPAAAGGDRGRCWVRATRRRRRTRSRGRSASCSSSEAPLLVVFDDIQWGEETFLDLVEQLALLSTGAPVLLALPGAAGARRAPPQWPVALRLEPLARRRRRARCCPRERPGRAARADRPRRRRQPAVRDRDGRDGGRRRGRGRRCRRR